MTVNHHFFKAIHETERTTDCNIFVEELMNSYNAEKKLNERLPSMILKAKTPEIVESLTTHLKFTQEHLHRLETFFKSINQSY